MPDRVKTTALESARAECDACPFTTEGVGALGNAARHHDATGHPVTVRTVRTLRYGTAADLDRAREERGQTTLGLP